MHLGAQQVRVVLYINYICIGLAVGGVIARIALQEFRKKRHNRWLCTSFSWSIEMGFYLSWYYCKPERWNRSSQVFLFYQNHGHNNPPPGLQCCFVSNQSRPNQETGDMSHLDVRLDTGFVFIWEMNSGKTRGKWLLFFITRSTSPTLPTAHHIPLFQTYHNPIRKQRKQETLWENWRTSCHTCMWQMLSKSSSKTDNIGSPGRMAGLTTQAETGLRISCARLIRLWVATTGASLMCQDWCEPQSNITVHESRLSQWADLESTMWLLVNWYAIISLVGLAQIGCCGKATVWPRPYWGKPCRVVFSASA